MNVKYPESYCEAISCEWTYQGDIYASLSCPDLNEIEIIEAVYGRCFFLLILNLCY